jgi:hypothetical protein
MEFDMGGMGSIESLEFGESMPRAIRLGDYVAIQKPGTYTATVLYHPNIRIGCTTQVNGLLCAKSLPLTIHVNPVQVETTEAEQASFAALIRRLPLKGPVRILGGGIDKTRVEQFYGKDAAAAQLKLAGWKAVPALIAAVRGKELTEVQRAWVIGLLFGITNQNNPLETPGVLGGFEYHHTGWVDFDTLSERISTSTSDMAMPEGVIDAKAQSEFIKAWEPWMDDGYIQVKKQ